jgi:PIN domain nuclease of toxin-antitoxin system
MPEVIVLDTHIGYWWITEDYQRFPVTWQDYIEKAGQVLVSPVSCFEIALAQQRGKLALPCDVGEWLEQALLPVGIELLPLNAAICAQEVALTPVHKDPFDRMIMASALGYRAQLASIDSAFVHYPELQSCLLTC